MGLQAPLYASARVLAKQPTAQTAPPALSRCLHEDVPTAACCSSWTPRHVRVLLGGIQGLGGFGENPSLHAGERLQEVGAEQVEAAARAVQRGVVRGERQSRRAAVQADRVRAAPRKVHRVAAHAAHAVDDDLGARHALCTRTQQASCHRSSSSRPPHCRPRRTCRRRLPERPPRALQRMAAVTGAAVKGAAVTDQSLRRHVTHATHAQRLAQGRHTTDQHWNAWVSDRGPQSSGPSPAWCRATTSGVTENQPSSSITMPAS